MLLILEIFSYLPQFIIYVINMSLKLKCSQLAFASKYLLILMNRHICRHFLPRKNNNKNRTKQIDLTKARRNIQTHTLSLSSHRY